jgi:hypothetical protein
MAALARRHGAAVLIDVAQDVSHMPVDVRALGCDFYVFSGHKVFAPTGIGAVYGRREVLATMPPWQGGGNMIADVTFERTRYQPPPARFEVGTGNIADAVGLGAALDWLERVGVANVGAWEHSLLEYGTARLQTVPGLRLIGTATEKAGVLSFVLAGQKTESLGARLDRYGTLLLGMNYLHEEPQAIFDAHAEFGRRLPPVLVSRPRWRPLAAGERLKVGYVSGDFVDHSVSFFIGALLERHDTTRFEITCYHNLGWSDATTERLKSHGHRWVECDGLSDAHLRRRIEEDGIHILIDLSGHTDHSRVFMFAQGAAPVQITYLGYPTVNGVPANEFRITDAVIDPGDMPSHAAEQPLRLPHTMFCSRPNQAPPIGPPPAGRVGA